MNYFTNKKILFYNLILKYLFLKINEKFKIFNSKIEFHFLMS